MNDKTKSMVRCALFAALIAACSQLMIPLPMIPINLALFAVSLAGAVLGPKWGTAAVLVYILLGVCGAPVFVGFKSGPAVLFGMTGGYILGYLFHALIVGLWTRKVGNSFAHLCTGMAAGVATCYAFGTIWFMILTGTDLLTSLKSCVFLFIPGDMIKIILAASLVRAFNQRRILA